MKVAVVGAGIAGLGCAHRLATAAAPGRPIQVVLYEAQPRLGGHTHTVDITLDGERFGVDTGFLVFNHRTYPNLLRLFETLQVPTAASEMSFGVSLPLNGGGAARAGRSPRRLEWAGANLGTVFAQRRNLLSPAFLGMLRDILRFNRQATQLATAAAAGGPAAALAESSSARVDPASTAGAGASLGAFLDANHYGRPFRDWYLLPMAAAIWSCPVAKMRQYPVATFARFCHNHGLLQVLDRPQWYTVRGGARNYVDRIAALLPDLRRGDPVQRVSRLPSGRLQVVSAGGQEPFDHVVLASHSDESLRLLDPDATAHRAVLAAVGYQPNRAVLHTDARLMPERRAVWSAWNYLSDGGIGEPGEPGAAAARVSVTYWSNRLQPLPIKRPVFVSLNPLIEPLPDQVLGTFAYAHPVFDPPALAAQRALPSIQGRSGIWLAGAWTGFGFHEDGLASGLAVADALLAAVATTGAGVGPRA